MNASTKGSGDAIFDYEDPKQIGMAALTLFALLLSVPMAIAAGVLGFASKRHPVLFSWQVILAGVGLTVILWIPTSLLGMNPLTWAEHALDKGIVFNTREAWKSAKPEIFWTWTLNMPLAPLFGWALNKLRDKDIEEQSQEDTARAKRREKRFEKTALKKKRRDVLVEEAQGQKGFVIGRKISGENSLPVKRSRVVLSPKQMTHHVLVMGSTGSGKTETALRMSYLIARATKAPLFYVDAKGDKQNAERFLGLMRAAGRGMARVFPNEPFNGWKGDSRDIANRLLEIISYTDEGPASWYKDVASLVVSLACKQPSGPPRSGEQLLERLDLHSLKSAYAENPNEVSLLTEQHVSQVRLRYQAFFHLVGDRLDGSWSWDDASCAYFLLDSLTLGEETSNLANYLFEDFSHYFTKRKHRNRSCFMVVDEFSALAASTSMAQRIEQARGFNTCLILMPQVVSGMGGEDEAARILGSAQTVVLHRLNTPEEIIALAGTKLEVEQSQQYEDGKYTGLGSSRLQHQFKIDPNEVRELNPGTAFIINRGKAMKAMITRAQSVRPVSLPPSQKTINEKNRDRHKGEGDISGDLPY